MWRAWVFVSGVPLGLLATFAAGAPDDPRVGLVLGGAGGLAWVALLSWAARRYDDDPERSFHLASGSGAAWAALPAAGACWLGLPPGPQAWGIALAVCLAGGVVRAARIRGPSGRLGRWVCVATASVVLAAAVEFGWVVATAGLGLRVVVPRTARTPAREPVASSDGAGLVGCTPRPEAVRTLLDRGANPRVDGRGRLWFDAPARDGSRQIYRRSEGEIVCWTCGAPGNNRRPAPSSNGLGVAFETDRHSSWREPANWEIHLAAASGEGSSGSSRRITFGSGPDLHPLLGPEAKHLVWLRARGGRAEIVLAPIETGHGGTLLGRAAVLAQAGSAWLAPLAWSRDARALVFAYGNPFGATGVRRLEPRGELSPRLETGVGRGAAFEGGSRQLVLASARRASALGLVPDAFGFVLGPWEAHRSLRGAVYRSTTLYVADAAGGLSEVALGVLAGWGEPTGIAVAHGQRAWILGQRRGAGVHLEERLLEIPLRCPP